MEQSIQPHASILVYHSSPVYQQAILISGHNIHLLFVTISYSFLFVLVVKLTMLNHNIKTIKIHA